MGLASALLNVQWWQHWQAMLQPDNTHLAAAAQWQLSCSYGQPTLCAGQACMLWHVPLLCHKGSALMGIISTAHPLPRHLAYVDQMQSLCKHATTCSEVAACPCTPWSPLFPEAFSPGRLLPCVRPTSQPSSELAPKPLQFVNPCAWRTCS